MTLDVKDPKKLDAVAVGDPVVAAFIEALALRVKKVPGATPGVSVTEARMTSKPGETPSGAVGREVIVTATITAVDRKAQTVTIKGPRGNTETIKVKDATNLTGVEAGDVAELTYTQVSGGHARPGRSMTALGRILAAAALVIVLPGVAPAQELQGTLKKIKDSGTIAVGYREQSVPFSFRGNDGKPTGYSIDLCQRVVDGHPAAAQADEARREVGRGHPRDADSIGRQRNDRSRVRLDDELALAARSRSTSAT